MNVNFNCAFFSWIFEIVFEICIKANRWKLPKVNKLHPIQHLICATHSNFSHGKKNLEKSQHFIFFCSCIENIIMWFFLRPYFQFNWCVSMRVWKYNGFLVLINSQVHQSHLISVHIQCLCFPLFSL